MLGDDVLEVLFGRVRMIRGHSPDVDVEELRNRIGSAIRLDHIYLKYPKWERRPDRLQLKRSRDVDHLSPRHWKGDLRAASCDLLACWKEGVQQAKAALSKAGFMLNDGLPIDFAMIFQDPKCDLMRPLKDPQNPALYGKYPGISAGVDRSLGQDAEESVSLEAVDLDEEYLYRRFDGKEELEAERASSQCQPFYSSWMDVEGRIVHKKSVLRCYFDRSLNVDYNKSHDRLLRIRCFSIGGDSWDRAKPRIHAGLSGDEVFKLGSLFATLVSVNHNSVALAILQCTLLKSGSELLSCAPLDEIALPDSPYEVSGQILSFLPIIRKSNNDPQAITLSWVWNSRYVALNSASKSRQKQTQSTSLHHLNIVVNGSLTYPLHSSQFMSVPTPQLDQALQEEVGNTWQVDENDMCRMELSLRRKIEDDDDLRLKIPVFGVVRDMTSTPFPYQATDGATWVINHSTTEIVAPSVGKTIQECDICGEKVSNELQQNHMGGHILRRYRGVQHGEDNLAAISLDFPCGFCGKSSAGGKCTIAIQSGKAQSTCSKAYKFMIHAAAKMSAKKACTNVPIRCEFCVEVHWKYNYHRHLQERHKSWNQRGDVRAFSAKIEITAEEEQRLHVPQDNVGCNSTLDAAIYDERRMGCTPSIRDPHNDSPRRPRHYQQTSPSPPLAPPTFIDNQTAYYNSPMTRAMTLFTINVNLCRRNVMYGSFSLLVVRI